EGKFDITDSIQVECEVGGELNVGGKLVIGEKGVVNANVQTVDAIIMGHYEGNMVATGNVEIAETGRVSGNIQTDSLVISKGGFFNGNITKMNDVNNRGVVAIDRHDAAIVYVVHLGDVAVEEAALRNHERIGLDISAHAARFGDFHVACGDHVAFVVPHDDGVHGLDVGVHH